jgi:hypothetical protein
MTTTSPTRVSTARRLLFTAPRRVMLEEVELRAP